ncbi:unnamed protein product, partial [Meganyctiphanes norvegica]
FPSEEYEFIKIEAQDSTGSLNGIDKKKAEPTCCSATLQDLLPYTTYQVVVKAVNMEGIGPPSHDATATTKEDAPNNPPPRLRCSPMTAHSVLVSWDDLPSSQARGKLLGYRVRYSAYGTFVSPRSETTSSLSVALRNLTPFTNYT